MENERVFSRKSKKAVPVPHITFYSHVWEQKGPGSPHLWTFHSLGEKNTKINTEGEDRIPLQTHIKGVIRKHWPVFNIKTMPFSALCINHSTNNEYDWTWLLFKYSEYSREIVLQLSQNLYPFFFFFLLNKQISQKNPSSSAASHCANEFWRLIHYLPWFVSDEVLVIFACKSK